VSADGPGRRRFPEGTTIEDLKAYMAPFAASLGYKFNTETEFVDEVLASEIEILDSAGDVYCPCRIRTGDPKEDVRIICPCIHFYRDQFAAMRKCWCGLFVLQEVADGAQLMGVIDEPEPGQLVEIPLCREQDLLPGQARHLKVGKDDIALVRVGAEYFALSNVCRHAHGPLADGFVEGYHLVCPWHGWRYDVRDGTTDHPNANVRTFEVVARDGCLFLKHTV
jgi:nitrite reductase/ring-hydroxylating ferredoxin subunit/ferredoxin-thioredoxin reductase catalytic subunit